MCTVYFDAIEAQAFRFDGGSRKRLDYVPDIAFRHLPDDLLAALIDRHRAGSGDCWMGFEARPAHGSDVP